MNSTSILSWFQTQLSEVLGHQFKGLYLLGSYALDDFSEKLSDIDFLVSTTKVLSKRQIGNIREIHTKIYRKARRPSLNGIYLPEYQIGIEAKQLDRLTYVHEGRLHHVHHQLSYYEINPVTWATFSQHGVALFGKSPSTFGLKPNWRSIDLYLHENINSYWHRWCKFFRRVSHAYFYQLLLRPGENAWCVSGVARQLFTLREQAITSKRMACEYLLDQTPVQFSSILTDTIQYRKGNPTRSAWQQKAETLAFMDYAIDQFNTIYRKKYACR